MTAEHEIALDRCFERVGRVRIAVFSDTHNGLFANAMPIARIAAAVNKARPDIVLVPGDYIYFLHPERFEETGFSRYPARNKESRASGDFC